MRESQEYRDSDKKLLLKVWETEGLFLTEAQRDKFFQCSTAESITRARRALKHKYTASDEVDNARFEKYKEYKTEAVSWLYDDI